jgi:HTH-type transcriptional regulator, sugar sensing transcriptional regulator
MEPKDELIALGLTDGEARVYLALLKLGTSTVGPIVKASGVAYSKIYRVLDRLQEKGFASSIAYEMTKHFQATPPGRISDYLDERKELIAAQEQRLNELLPLLRKHSAKGHPDESAQIFVGFKGLKTAYELLLQGRADGEELLFFYNHDKASAKANKQFYEQAFHLYRKLGARMKGIATRDFKESPYFLAPPGFIDLRYVDFPLPSTIDICGEHVLITSWQDKPIGYLIHSNEVAESLRTYFFNVWKHAKK